MLKINIDNRLNNYDVIVCPGVHNPSLTDSFIQNLKDNNNRFGEQQWSILPTQNYAPYSPVAVYQWLNKHYHSPSNTPPIIFICFSAGVVGGLGAALWWQKNGGKVKAFFAFDGWGMPIVKNFPVYRLSHDYFTHWSSAILGQGDSSFYADPEVAHLELWRSPNNTVGWWVKSPGMKARCSVAEFLQVFFD